MSCTGQFHVQVHHNLHNLNLVINTYGEWHKKGITDKKNQGIFRKNCDQMLRDLSLRY